MLKLTGMKWLVLTHRWVGIVTCLFCAVWFVSGLVMVYVPYPSLSDRDRMAYSEPLSLDRVAVAPDAALAAAGASAWPSQLKLTMLRDEPVWRVLDGKRRVTVSAVDGRRIAKTSAAEAEATVRRLLPAREVAGVRTLTRDQWTVAQGFDPHRPLHKVSLKGADGLTLYVSSQTGEVVNDTNRTERGWNWIGSIPHWIYPTVLRQDNEAWRQVIMWTSGPALLGAFAGAWLGILRMRLKRGQTVSPFRGWMKWHHWAGLLAGVFAITWLFSGWLSVNPFQWFPRRQTPEAALAAYAGHGAATFPMSAEGVRKLPLGEAREARLTWVGGRPLTVLMGPSLAQVPLEGGAPAVFTDAALIEKARALAPPGAAVTAAGRLTRPDAYWYPTLRDVRRLPVLRVEFGDRYRTWVHIDPATGEVLGQTDSTRRAYRWLFSALHAWDLPVFGGSELVRQLVVWILSIGGVVMSLSGVVIGWRHLKLAAGVRPAKTA